MSKAWEEPGEKNPRLPKEQMFKDTLSAREKKRGDLEITLGKTAVMIKGP